MPNILIIVIYITVLLFSVILHEVSHGWMAERFGDDTARVMGRLTFNPIPHIDIIGTIVLPALLLLNHVPPIGWAKPVPVNPYHLNNPKRDMMWVGLAGPMSNVGLAVVSAILLWFIRSFPVLPEGFASALYDLASLALQVNVWLCLFNLVPVPPLDGSRVVMGLLPHELAYRYAQTERYGFIIILVLFYTGIISAVISPVANTVISALSGRMLM